MPRIFHRPDEGRKQLAAGETVTLPEPEAKRLHRVLRLCAGDTLTIFDGKSEFSAVIRSISPKSAEIELTEKTETHTEPPVRILLGQGLPKGEKLEWALQKSTELGVSGFVPVVLGRSVRTPRPGSETKSLERMRTIAAEAAAQSGRISPPEVHGFTDLEGFMDISRGADLKIVPYESESTRGMADALSGASGVKSVAVLVGPEGGLTEEEVARLTDNGFVAVRLGPRILRTETAGITAVALVQYVLGDLGGAA